MDAVDEYIPTPERDVDKPFLMADRGHHDHYRPWYRCSPVVLSAAVLHVNDPLEIVGIKETQQTTVCTGIEMFRKLLDEAAGWR